MSGSRGAAWRITSSTRGDALLDGARVARVQPQLALGVGLVEDLAVPARSITGTSASSPRRSRFQSARSEAALGLEGGVDGLERDARLGRDRGHRRRRVALALEQPLGRLEDVAARGGRLLAPARRVVASAWG